MDPPPPTDDDFGSALSTEFWREFTENHWERAPRVIKQPFARPIATVEDIFRAIVTASRVCLETKAQRRGSYSPRVRFYADGAERMANVDDLLPGSRDEDATDYFARMDRQLAGRLFEIVAFEVQEYSFAVWSRLRHFVRGLYRCVGLPKAQAHSLAFLRTQTCTNFGVHRDYSGVFLFVIQGHKRILAWPEDAMRGRERFVATTEYEAIRDDAVVLEGEPGDILYWPSSYWHIGESDGGPSVSLNLALRLWQPSMAVLRQLGQLAQRRVADGIVPTWPIDPDDLEASARAVPEAMQNVLEAAREIAASAGLGQYLEFSWLKRVTGAGFNCLPAPRAHHPLTDDDVVRLVRDEPIVRIPLGDDRVAISAAGHGFVVPASPHVSRLFERLDDGEEHQVGPLLQMCMGWDDDVAGSDAVADHDQIEALRSILEKLVQYRALARELSR